MMGIPILGKKPTETGELPAHRITLFFPDDHTIDGLKMDVIGVTPEQIFIATMHLQRIAMASLAQRDTIARQAEAEAMAVRESLAREAAKGN